MFIWHVIELLNAIPKKGEHSQFFLLRQNVPFQIKEKEKQHWKLCWKKMKTVINQMRFRRFVFLLYSEHELRARGLTLLTRERFLLSLEIWFSRYNFFLPFIFIRFAVFFFWSFSKGEKTPFGFFYASDGWSFSFCLILAFYMVGNVIVVAREPCFKSICSIRWALACDSLVAFTDFYGIRTNTPAFRHKNQTIVARFIRKI